MAQDDDGRACDPVRSDQAFDDFVDLFEFTGGEPDFFRLDNRKVLGRSWQAGKGE